jgi:bleomycin hydrolase
MKNLFIFLVMFLAVVSIKAQTGITPDMLKELQSMNLNNEQKAIQNVLTQNDGNKISLNWDKIREIDPYFSLRLKDQKITDQKATGRCWLFAGLNLLRPLAAKKLKCPDFEFSQNYNYFYEKLEKAYLFLESIIKTKDKPYTDRYIEFLFKQNIQDGQNWVGYVELIKKYGVVPKDVMPETYSSSNSGHVSQALAQKLKQYALKIRNEKDADKTEELKISAMKDVYKILTINFGVPPKSFEWRYENSDKKIIQIKPLTPQEFYKEIVNENLDDFFALYSVPVLPFNKKYEIELDRILNDKNDMYFVNIPLETMKELTKKCILDSIPVLFGCDVGKESSWENGVMADNLYDYGDLYNLDFNLSRKELFETYSSIPTHNMVFTGIDILNGKIKKWLVENSWGDGKGKRGYFYMSNEWFDKYVQVVVLNKKYIPKEIQDIFKTKSEMLPPWDPMMKVLNMIEN